MMESDYETSPDRPYPTTATESAHNVNYKHYVDDKLTSPTVSDTT